MKGVKLFLILVIAFQSETNGLSLSPPSEEIFSNQLCPDPTTKSQISGSASLSKTSNSNETTNPKIPERVLAINLDKPRDSTHFYESCTFKEEQRDKGSGVKRRLRNIRVRSINLNANSWNFSTAESCPNFIKFNNWDTYEGGGYPVLCGRENFDQFLGPYGHPMVLYYQWKNGGLSFPLFHSSFRGDHTRDRKDGTDLQFLQIYFSVNTGAKDFSNKCRVQQYRLDWLRLGCSSPQLATDEVCGEYDCGELETLYQKRMTIFKEGGNDTNVLLFANNSDTYRVRTFVRSRFVPIVFLFILIFAYRSYMKAGLKYRNSAMQDDISELRVRSIRTNLSIPSRVLALGPAPIIRDQMTTTDPDWDLEAGVLTPEGQSRGQGQLPSAQPKTDMPPSYEEICVSPPTYKEATKP